MSPIPISYQIFECHNTKYQFFKFDIPEYLQAKDEHGKILTNINIHAEDEEIAYEKVREYVDYCKKN